MTSGPREAIVPETSEPSMTVLPNQRGTLKSLGFIAAQTFLMRISSLQGLVMSFEWRWGVQTQWVAGWGRL